MKEDNPPGFPTLTLPIMRALCALTILHPGAEGQELLAKCLDVLFPAYWKEHRNTIDKDVLVGILSGVLGKEETAEGAYLCVVLGRPSLIADSDGYGRQRGQGALE
jgi:2-hydroxychromene-2-carboxylate isomerase